MYLEVDLQLVLGTHVILATVPNDLGHAFGEIAILFIRPSYRNS